MTDETHKTSTYWVRGGMETLSHNRYGGGVSYSKSTSGKCERESSGVKNPMWKQLISSGNNATTPFQAQETMFYPMSGYADIRYTYSPDPNPGVDVVVSVTTQGTEVIPPWQGKSFYYLINQLSGTKADNEAKANFVKKARAAQTSFQGGVFLGEIRETIGLLRSPVKSLRRGLNAYLAAVKKRSRRIRSTPKSKRKGAAKRIISDTWLEHSFGWVPLIHDIDDGLKTLTDAMVKEWPSSKLVVAYGKDKIKYLDSYAIIGTATTPYLRFETRQFTEVFVKYYGKVSIGSNSVSNLQRIGLDVSNWLPTLWELVPYSFLVDYFTNIGDIVSAASFNRSDVRWINRTEVRSDIQEAHQPSVIAPASTSSISVATRCSASTGVYYKRRVVDRDIYHGDLVPSLEFSIPGIGKRWLNMAALVNNSRRTSKQINRYLNG
jgi:hypothetical protein